MSATKMTKRTLSAVFCVDRVIVAAITCSAMTSPLYGEFIGRIATTYETTGDEAMSMPTDVAVAQDGMVFVADGVQHRVARFSSDGTAMGQITRAGDDNLSSPIGLFMDAQGRLWIADTGNRRVIALASDGTVHATLGPAQLGDSAEDVTDVVLSDDGKIAWIVSNDSHRLTRISLPDGAPVVVGGQGRALGQFDHPFFIATQGKGEIAVSDVINGRVQVLDKDGKPLRRIGSYGADLGQLYRPKGVAFDKDGNLWIGDGTLGVIQVFAASGAFIGVLQNAEGEPLRFAHPSGITFDNEGNLYVVELEADRVRKLAISRQMPDPRRRPEVVEGLRTGADSCTICHFEWMEIFDSPSGSRIVEKPESTRQQPYVSTGEACLSCHDGSVVDSRRRVWAEHGHATGMKPPESMQVPPQLPLVDGRVACRTCHSAHATGEPENDIAKAVFLRVRNTASQLCIMCHEDKTRGPEGGTHPTGGMPWAVPEPLIQAGAQVGPNPRELTCQVCHTPHGSGYEHLLVMGASSNQLCMECHDQMRPGMFRDGTHAEHPLNVQVNARQRAAIDDLGTRVAPDGTLVCLSCHQLHHGKGSRFMLAEELEGGRFCLRCHDEKKSVLMTKHDLRNDFPDEKNRLGMTASTGGTCSSCHLFHRYARLMEPGPGDPSGTCLTCHKMGECAENATGQPFSHPTEVPAEQLRRLVETVHEDDHEGPLTSFACVACHDPHEADHAHFLRAQPDTLCSTCHTEQAPVLTGVHDFTGKSIVNSKGATADSVGTCVFCHAIHDAKGPALWSATAKAPSSPAEFCTACHGDNAHTQLAPHAELRHPSGWKPAWSRLLADSSLPRIGEGGRPHPEGDLSCATCHDPHGGRDATQSLLRLSQGQSPVDLCLSCHADQRTIEASAHNHRMLADLVDQSTCGPCHAVHKLEGMPDTMVDGATLLHCTDCHKKGGPAPAVHMPDHPEAHIVNLPGMSGDGLPIEIVEHNGETVGRITCNTCHVPHGRPAGGGFELLDPAVVSEAMLRNMRSMLRPYNPPNVCSSCHGFDGLRRYLYFHKSGAASSN